MLILPLFDYGDAVYDCLSQKDIAILQRLQNCAMRSILNAHRFEHICDMHANLGLNTLEVRCKQHTCVHVYKGLNDLSTPAINNMFVLNDDGDRMQTRSASNMELVYPNIKLSTSRKGIRYQGVKTWNPVEIDIKTAPSYDSFKNRIRTSNIIK